MKAKKAKPLPDEVGSIEMECMNDLFSIKTGLGEAVAVPNHDGTWKWTVRGRGGEKSFTTERFNGRKGSSPEEDTSLVIRALVTHHDRQEPYSAVTCVDDAFGRANTALAAAHCLTGKPPSKGTAFSRGGARSEFEEGGFEWAVAMHSAFAIPFDPERAAYASRKGLLALLDSGMAKPFDLRGLSDETVDSFFKNLILADRGDGKAMAFARECCAKSGTVVMEGSGTFIDHPRWRLASYRLAADEWNPKKCSAGFRAISMLGKRPDIPEYAKFESLLSPRGRDSLAGAACRQLSFHSNCDAGFAKLVMARAGAIKKSAGLELAATDAIHCLLRAEWTSEWPPSKVVDVAERAGAKGSEPWERALAEMSADGKDPCVSQGGIAAALCAGVSPDSEVWDLVRKHPESRAILDSASMEAANPIAENPCRRGPSV